MRSEAFSFSPGLALEEVFQMSRPLNVAIQDAEKRLCVSAAAVDQAARMSSSIRQLRTLSGLRRPCLLPAGV